MRTLLTAVFCLLTLGAAADSNAQALPSSPELGVGVLWLVPRNGDHGTNPLAEPDAEARVALPFARRFAFEAIVTIGRQPDDLRGQKAELFALQTKQQLPGFDKRPVRMFITYGSLGVYFPISPIVGVGVQRRLDQKIAIRGDAQLLTFVTLPIGYSYTASLSLPIGR